MIRARNYQASKLRSSTNFFNIHELPDWMQNDQYIRRGYRIPQNSIRGCFQSLWYLHNETVNIWSHLLTAMFMTALLGWSFVPTLHQGYSFSASDLGVLQFYLLCSIGGLIFSVGVSVYLPLFVSWRIKTDLLASHSFIAQAATRSA